MDITMNIALIARVKQGDIYAALQKRGWSVPKAAEYIGMSSGKLYKMINLQVAPTLTIEQEVKLAELTGKTLEQLFPKEFNAEEFLEGRRLLVAFRECDPRELAHTGIRCLPISLSARDEELLAVIEGHLDQLKKSERAVIIARYVEKKTLQEIATDRDITRERVRQIQLRAEKRLRELIQKKQ